MSDFVFLTPRLGARKILWTDVDALLGVYGDREVVRWVGDGQPLERALCEKWVAVTHRNYATRGYGMLALVERASGVVVGFCGLVHPDGQDDAEIKYAFHRSHWGQGFATEAASALLAYGASHCGLAEIMATTAPENLASHHVLLKAGMQRGVLKEYPDGTFTQYFVWRPGGSRSGPLPSPFTGGVLRRLRAGDLTAFQAYRGIPELGRFQGWSPMSDEQAAEFLTEMAHAPLFQPGDWVQLGIAEPETDRLIGDIGILVAADGGAAEIGFTLAPAAQGRGIATAAVRRALQLVFGATGVQQVVGIADRRNAASLRLLERVGFCHQESRSAVFRAEACIEEVYVLPRRPDTGSRS